MIPPLQQYPSATKVAATAFALVTIFVLAGCTSSSPAPVEVSEEQSASSPDTSTPSPDGQTVPEQTEGCEWITIDVAAEVLGASVTASGPTAGHLSAIDDCNFSTDPTDALPVGSGITYQVIDYGSIESAQSAFASMNVAGGTSFGIGDESAESGTAVGTSTIVRFGSVTSAVLLSNVKNASDGAIALQKEIGTHLGY